MRFLQKHWFLLFTLLTLLILINARLGHLWGRKPPKTRLLTAGSRTQLEGADARPRPNCRKLRSPPQHSRQGAGMPSRARQGTPHRGGRAQAQRARTQAAWRAERGRSEGHPRARRGVPRRAKRGNRQRGRAQRPRAEGSPASGEPRGDARPREAR